MVHFAAWGAAGWLALMAVLYLRGVAPDAAVREFLLALGGPYDASGFAATWLGTVRALGAAALVLAAGLGLGGRLAGWMGMRVRGAWHAVAAWGVGLAGVTVAVAGLGLTGLLHPAFLALVLAGAAAGGWRAFPAAAAELRPLAGGGVLARACLAGLASLLLFQLGPALAPEMGWDALTYHLHAPARWLAAGRIFTLPQSLWSFYPFSAEMLFLPAQALGGDAGAKLVNFAFLPLTALALAAAGAAAGDAAAGWLAGLLYVSLPASAVLSGQCYNDLETAFFVLLACGTALVPRGPGLVAAGALAGAALGCKHSGWWNLAVVLALAVWAGRRDGIRFGRLAAAAAAAALVAAVWPARNWLLTGNPLYPLLGGWLSAPDWNPYFSPREAAVLLPAGGGPGFGAILLGLARLPFDFSFSFGVVGLTFGPALFGLLPVLLLRGSPAREDGRENFAAPLAVAGCASLLVSWLLLWVVSPTGNGRYLTPVAALLSFPAAVAALRLARRGAAVGTVLGVLGALVLGGQFLSWLGFMSQNYKPWRVAAGLEPRELYVTRGLQPRMERGPMAGRIDASIPRGARILMFADILGHYVGRDTVFDTQQVMPPVAMRLLRGRRDAADARKRMRQLGLTHVLYSPMHLPLFQRQCGCLDPGGREGARLEEFWRRYAEFEFGYGGMMLFRLRTGRGRGAPAPFLILPGVADAARLEADGEMEAGRAEGAVTVYRRLVGRFPGMAEAHDLLGDALLAAGRAAEAGREYAAAERQGADGAPHWMRTARVRLVLRDAAGATAAARRAVERAPTPRAKMLLAACLAAGGEAAPAALLAREAVREDPYDESLKKTAARLR